MPAKSSLVRSHTLQAFARVNRNFLSCATPQKSRTECTATTAPTRHRYGAVFRRTLWNPSSGFMGRIGHRQEMLGVGSAGRQLINDFDPKSAGSSDATLTQSERFRSGLLCFPQTPLRILPQNELLMAANCRAVIQGSSLLWLCSSLGLSLSAVHHPITSLCGARRLKYLIAAFTTFNVSSCLCVR